jgi:hypothetical protein
VQVFFFLILNQETDESALEWITSLRAVIYYLNLRQIYLDPRNFLRTEIDNSVSRAGFLSKKGKGLTLTKKKRYFILKNGVLSYYKGVISFNS